MNKIMKRSVCVCLLGLGHSLVLAQQPDWTLKVLESDTGKKAQARFLQMKESAPPRGKINFPLLSGQPEIGNKKIATIDPSLFGLKLDPLTVWYQGKEYSALEVKQMELPRELGKALVVSDLLVRKFPTGIHERNARAHVLMAAGQYREAYLTVIPILSMNTPHTEFAILLAAINNEVQPGMRETLCEMISPGNVQYFEHYCDSSREIAILAKYVIGASFTRTGREKIGEHYFRWALQDDPTNAFVIYVLCQRMALNRFPAEGKPLLLWGIRHAEGDLKREMESTLRQREQAYQEHYGPVSP